MATFLLRCNALALFSFVLCDILTEERLSPVPAEAGYRQRLDDQACIYFVLIHSIDRNLQARGFVENTQSPDFMITTNREGSPSSRKNAQGSHECPRAVLLVLTLANRPARFIVIATSERSETGRDPAVRTHEPVSRRCPSL
jgi:hypothetical protein